MKVRQLNKAQYLRTMGNKMNHVTECAEPLVDVWSYAEELLNCHLISEYGFSRRYVEAVYENDEHTFQHILLFANQENTYAAVIVDMTHKTIFGHYLLDLNKEYGLNRETKENEP